MADEEAVPRPQSVTMLMTWRELLRIAVVGAVVGVITAALYVILNKYVFTPVLCSSIAGAGRCENKLYFASALATIFGAILALFAVVQLRVFRPLLVVIVVTIGLWNIVMLTAPLSLGFAALVPFLLFGIAYALFAWVVQIRNLYVALAIAVVLVVALRLILSL